MYVTVFFFFFNDTATTEIYTLSLHDALPIFDPAGQLVAAAFMRTEHRDGVAQRLVDADHPGVCVLAVEQGGDQPDRRADGEEADDGVALCERAGQRPGRGPVVAAGVGPGFFEPSGGCLAGGGDADQADHRRPHRTKTGFSAARRSWPPWPF